MPYAHDLAVPSPFEQTVEAVREALAEQGFGVLTEIDVKSTLKAKLDEDVEDYLILGACNPQLAHRALEVDRTIGVLLPCNVVVRAQGTGSLVQFLDPQVMVSIPGDDRLAPVAEEAGRRLDAARSALQQRLAA